MRALITSPVMRSFEKVIVAIKVIKANKPLSKAIVAPKASKAIIANTFKPANTAIASALFYRLVLFQSGSFGESEQGFDRRVKILERIVHRTKELT